jgi:coniferyl-aldehyde dehydrogenase
MTTQANAIPAQRKTLKDAFDRQQRAFRQYAPLGHTRRTEALNALLHSVLQHEKILVEAVNSDFGQRSPYETQLLDIFPVVDEIRHVKRNLRRWMQPRSAHVNWQFVPSRAKILYQPLGVVGVIGAWNYPILLNLSPLVSALAAGNHVMVKPSEHAPATASALHQMIREAFPEEYVTVITGGTDVAEIFSALPFDHLLYTGSARVGKLIMKAAAENLTPVTLELGGKSPALVHESYSMAVAADRICSAKFWNAGQTCVSPDYALVPSHKVNEFVGSCLETISKRFSHPFSNADYTHMIGENARRRMQDLVDDALANGGQVIQPGTGNETSSFGNRIFPPTLVVEAKDSMRIMQEEIFGPILPIMTYSSLDDAVEFINARPRPLALYYFDRNSSRIGTVLEQTVSGGVTVNDCIFHLPQHRLPFGGIGPSGMGAYHGFDGFTAFSKKKGVLLQNALVGWSLDRAFKPPYTALSHRLMRFLLGRSKSGRVQKVRLGRQT